MKLAPFRHIFAQAPFKSHRVQLSGADAVSFLQGQSTQTLSTNWGIHSFLDRAGKIECHFIAWQEESHITILVSSECHSALLTRFERYVISEDVESKDLGLEEWWFATGGRELSQGHRGQLLTQDCWLLPQAARGVTQVSKEELHHWFKWQGIPPFDQAFQVGNLINQTRLFEIAVSLQKGCFPGQEVVAKVHHNRGAAWLPVLLQTSRTNQALAELKIEDRLVARVSPEGDEGWYQADVLRDVRVAGLVLAGSYQVHFYPRWPMAATERATELFHIGTEAFAKGDEVLARKSWELAIEIDPNCADAYEAIGVLLGRQEKFVEAESWMRRLLEVDPNSVMAHTNLSLFLMRQDRIQEAEDHKAKATVAQFAVFGRKAAADKQTKEQQEQAQAEQLTREKMFLQVLEIDPEDSLANHGLGVISYERREFQKARSLFEKVLASDSSHAVSYLWLGKTLIALSDKTKAKEIFASGIRLAAKRGEMMPANEMQALLTSLE